MQALSFYLVEDLKFFREDYERQIQSLGHHVIGSAESGEQALAEVPRLQPDIILLDMVLAGTLTGLDVAKKLTRLGAYSFLIVTSNYSTTFFEQFQDITTDGFILKPYQPEQFTVSLLNAVQVKINRQKLELGKATSRANLLSQAVDQMDQLLWRYNPTTQEVYLLNHALLNHFRLADLVKRIQSWCKRLLNEYEQNHGQPLQTERLVNMPSRQNQTELLALRAYLDIQNNQLLAITGHVFHARQLDTLKDKGQAIAQRKAQRTQQENHVLKKILTKLDYTGDAKRLGYWYTEPQSEEVYLSTQLLDYLQLPDKKPVWPLTELRKVLSDKQNQLIDNYIAPMAKGRGEKEKTFSFSTAQPPDNQVAVNMKVQRIGPPDSLLLMGIVEKKSDDTGSWKHNLNSNWSFETSMNHSPLGIFILANDLTILYANRVALQKIRISKDRLLGSNLSDYLLNLPPNFLAFANGERNQAELKQNAALKTNQSNDMRSVRLYASRISAHDLMVFVEDITNQEKTQEELDRYRNHLERLVIRRTGQLSAKNKDLSEANSEIVAANKELEDNQRLFQALMNHLPQGLQIFDLDGYNVLCNMQQYALFGDGHNDFPNQNILTGEFARKHGIREQALLAMQGEVMQRSEIKLTHTTDQGQPADVYLSYFVFPIYSTKKEVRNIVTLFEDITEKKRAEQAEKEREELFRNMFYQHNAVMLLINHKTGQIINANKAAIKFYGYTKEQLLQRSIFDINTMSAAEITQAMERAQGNKENVFTFRHQLANGKLRDVHVYSSRIYYQNNYVLFSIIHDITEQRLAQEQLKESEAKFRNFVEQSPLGVIMANENLEVKEWNKSMGDLLMISRAQAMGKQLPALLEASHLHFTIDVPVAQWLHQYMRNDNQQVTENQEVTFYSDTHQQYVLNATLTQMHVRGQRHLVIIASDITKEKEAEQKIINALNKEKELNAMKSSFVSMASHQLKTPLTSIRSSVDIIELLAKRKKEHAFERIQKHTARINEVMDWLNQIINNFLTISREESGKIPLKPEDSDLTLLCKDVAIQYNSREDSAQQVIFTTKGKPRLVRLDYNLMKHALMNLVNNGLKYSDEHVQLQLYFYENHVNIEVADNGIGIDANDQKHIFDSFYRGANVKSISGTGLGLVITKRFVEMNKGSLSLESELNKGSTFTIYLPM